MSPPSGASSERSSAASPRLSREATVALVLLPVLLVAGFLIGTRLLDGEDPVAAPAAPASAAPQGSAAPEPTAGPEGTPAPDPTTAPEPTPAPEPIPPSEPTAAPQPPAAPEPTAAPPAAPPAAASADVPVPDAGADLLLAPGSVSEDVRRWQARMSERGWDLAVDGIYGPQTASVATRFQAEQGLTVDGLVGPQTWSAAWSADPA